MSICCGHDGGDLVTLRDKSRKSSVPILQEKQNRCNRWKIIRNNNHTDKSDWQLLFKVLLINLTSVGSLISDSYLQPHDCVRRGADLNTTATVVYQALPSLFKCTLLFIYHQYFRAPHSRSLDIANHTCVATFMTTCSGSTKPAGEHVLKESRSHSDLLWGLKGL